MGPQMCLHMIQFCKIGETLLTSTYCPLVVHHGKHSSKKPNRVGFVSDSIQSRKIVGEPPFPKQKRGTYRCWWGVCFVAYSVRRETEIVLKHLQNLAAHMVRKTLPASRQLGSTWHISPFPNDYISTGQSEGRYRQSARPKTHTFAVAIYTYQCRLTDDGRSFLPGDAWAESRYPLSGFWLLLTLRVVIQRKTVDKLMFHAYVLMFLPMSLYYPLLCFKIVAENLGEWYPPMSETVQRPVCLVCVFTRAFRWLSLGDCQD